MAVNNYDTKDLTGKTVVVTGCNTGIGKETAKQMAKKGARVIMACRTAEKAHAARDDIVKETSNEKVVFMKLDLASLESVRVFAAEFNKNEARLDLLINNAGIYVPEREESPDGYEWMLAANHLGHFLLTNLLLDKIKASSPSRIVNVSSLGHEKNPIDFDDLQSEKNFDGMKVYGKSKTANVLFSVHLAQMLEGTGVTVYSLHPGAIASDFGRNTPVYHCCHCCYTCLYCCMSCLLFGERLKSIEEGAQTTLYCALEPSIADHSGRYYSDCREKTAKAHATNQETAQKFWNVSKEMCGI